jgi:hypothetical protein
MPYGQFINLFPPAAFLAVHLVAFGVGSYFAYRAFEGGAGMLGWGFALFALAEIVYMTYHLDWTVFLFAHTIAEVFDLVAFVLVFAAVGQRSRAAARGSAVGSCSCPGPVWSPASPWACSPAAPAAWRRRQSKSRTRTGS